MTTPTTWQREVAASIAEIGPKLPLRLFAVQINRAEPFEVMATDSETVFKHADLAQGGRVEVRAL